MDLPSLFFKGLSVKNSIKLCISVPEDCFFILGNSADSNEILP